MSSALPYEVVVFDDRICELGEGPVWDEASGRAMWVDILNSRVLWRSVASGETGVVDFPSHVAAVVPTEEGRWLACLVDGVYDTDLQDGNVARVAEFSHHVTGGAVVQMRANDAKVSPDGVLFCGTMPYTPDEHPKTGALYVLRDGVLRTVVDQVTISNGIGWSPDSSRIYYVDSPTGRIDWAPYPGPDEVLDWQIFAHVNAELGLPDGLTVDADGCVWVAVWGAGRILKFLPDGQLDGHLVVPCSQTTSCAFIGDDLQTMMITTAKVGLAGTGGCGKTYAVRLPAPGLPQPRVSL